MAPLFYDHLVIKTSIIEIINQKPEPENQKGKALQLIDDIIYEGIMAHVLEKLDTKHHTTFLTQVQERPYDPELINYLKEHIGSDIEDEIRQEADKVVKKILKDLQ
ncbi:MAG TPA: hypothetical protein PLI45_02455 [Candidatus Woesebacteria bacterium]|nr:hypothetical protein [Candidatus Woesebacteria bacterium]